MRKRLRAIARLALWQKLVVVGMVLLIILTWLAVCLVLAGFFGP